MKRILSSIMLSLFLATAGFSQATGTTIYFPHVVNGLLAGSYKTTIFLTNPAASGTLNATILFTGEVKPTSSSGVPLSMSFTDQNGTTYTGSTISITNLGPGQSVKLASSGTGTFASGFATVVATAPITGGATFANFDPSGRLVSEAGVPASAAVLKQSIFVDTVGGYNIGIAYATPDTGSTNVQLRLLNSAGVEVATTTHALGGGNHRAAFPNELFSAVPISVFNEFTGTMQVTGSVPLAALALWYDPTFTIFTTLSPVQIAGLISPAREWLMHSPWQQLVPLARFLASVATGRA